MRTIGAVILIKPLLSWPNRFPSSIYSKLISPMQTNASLLISSGISTDLSPFQLNNSKFSFLQTTSIQCLRLLLKILTGYVLIAIGRYLLVTFSDNGASSRKERGTRKHHSVSQHRRSSLVCSIVRLLGTFLLFHGDFLSARLALVLCPLPLVVIRTCHGLGSREVSRQNYRYA